PGFFQVTIPHLRLPISYELDVVYPDGNSFTVRDPYAFPPTLGELDLHLVGEGRHEGLYERLGAHPTRIGDVSGTAFAVWAPAAPRDQAGRHRVPPRLAPPGLRRRRGHPRAADPPPLGLRGPPRQLAARPPRPRPPARLPRARRPARRLRRRARLHPHRADAGHGPPVQRILGLPGDLLLRPDADLRLA